MYPLGDELVVVVGYLFYFDGMKALCIDDFWYHDYIRQGKEYEVLSLDVDGNQIEIDIDKPFRVFDIDRFKLLDVDFDKIKKMRDEIKEMGEEIEDHEDAIFRLESSVYDMESKTDNMWLKIKSL